MSRASGLLASPSRVAGGAWLLFALLGTVLFRMDRSTTGEPLGWVDALFLSTSAIGVTGLSPVASLTGTLSETGWWILLALIQLGGVGLAGKESVDKIQYPEESVGLG